MFSAVLPITDMGRLSRAARPSAGQNRGTICPASHFLTDTALYAHFCLIAFLRTGLISSEKSVGREAQMISSFKAVPEIRTLIEKIKDDRKKRAEAKARRMLLRRPKRLTKR